MPATSLMRRNGDLFISSAKIVLFLCGCFWPVVDLPTAKVLPHALHR